MVVASPLNVYDHHVPIFTVMGLTMALEASKRLSKFIAQMIEMCAVVNLTSLVVTAEFHCVEFPVTKEA